MNRGKLRDDEQLDRQTITVAASLFPGLLNAAYGGRAPAQSGTSFRDYEQECRIGSWRTSSPVKFHNLSACESARVERTFSESAA